MVILRENTKVEWVWNNRLMVLISARTAYIKIIHVKNYK